MHSLGLAISGVIRRKNLKITHQTTTSAGGHVGSKKKEIGEIDMGTEKLLGWEESTDLGGR